MHEEPLVNPSEEASPIRVEIIESPPTRKGKRGRSELKRGQAGGAALSKFGVKLLQGDGEADRPDAGFWQEKKELEGIYGSSWNWDSEGKGYSLYRYLYTQIDANLTYPNDLIRAGESGEVSGTISFSEEGQYLRSFTSLRSESPYLRVVVLRVLRGAFSTPIPKKMLLHPRRWSIGIRVSFEIRPEQSQDPNWMPAPHAQNRLFFRRSVPTPRYAVQLKSLPSLSGLGHENIIEFDLTRIGKSLFGEKSELKKRYSEDRSD